MNQKNLTLFVVVLMIVGAIVYIEAKKPASAPNSSQDIVLTDDGVKESDATTSMPNASSTVSSTTPSNLGNRDKIRAMKAAEYPRAKELADIQGYINTDKFKLADLVGKKVILIDFWTYSCINCQRTIPYLNAWYEKYKDQGFVIVGVHTPEFDFEKNYDNVAKAVKDLGIKYPVVLDSNEGTWNAYGNVYWPREYLIDIDGFIVHDHAGEGSYDETERAIQAALKEKMDAMGEKGAVDTSVANPTDAVPFDPYSVLSPETYFGSNRNEYLGNGDAGKSGEQYFAEPAHVFTNMLYLIGQWNITPEHAETSASVGSGETGSDRVDYLYHSSRVYFVAGASGTPVDVEVTVDGKPVDQSVKGADIFYKDGRSYVSVSGQKLYKLIEGNSSEKHLLELIVSKPGLQAFTFTFG